MSEKQMTWREKLYAFFVERKIFFLPCITFSFILVMIFSIMMLFLRINLLLLIVPFAVLGLMGTLFLNIEQDDAAKKKAFILWQALLSATVASIISLPIIKAINAFMAMGTASSGIGVIPTILYMVLISGTVLFWLSDTGKKLVEHLKEFNIYAKTAETGEKKKGDVVLCKVKESGEDEIWHYKDRFLHMLILGPTGSGKTSQTILPLINQDMQNLDAGITVLEPKGDLAQKAAMMAEHYGRPYMYFDPSLEGCPHFNPMSGKESDVVENMATTFRMLNPDSPQFFLDLNEQLMRNAVKVLKRLDQAEGLDGKWANLINLGRLLQNSGGAGRDIVTKFAKIAAPTPDIAKENQDIASWFLNDYLSDRSKVYENCSGVRSQVAKITSNEFLRSVLNPDVERGEKNDIDFDAHLENGGVICISTAQGTLRELGKFLGYFIVLQLQSAVFRRPGNENTRRAHFLYIDEFQTYANPGFSDMLTQGRSYRVASHLATQARAQIGMGSGREGNNFVQLVSTNARNIILYPGCSYDDAKFYSDQFGEYMKKEVQVGISRKKFNLFTGGFDKLGHPTESIRETEKLMAVFSPTDLIYRPFGEITYCLISNNSIQTPKVGEISYIPKDLNDKLDTMIEGYIKSHQFSKSDPWEEMRRKKAEEEAAKEAAKNVVQTPAENIGTTPVTPVTGTGKIDFEKQPVIKRNPAPEEMPNELPDIAPTPEPLSREPIMTEGDINTGLERFGDDKEGVLDLGFNDDIEDDDIS